MHFFGHTHIYIRVRRDLNFNCTHLCEACSARPSIGKSHRALEATPLSHIRTLTHIAFFSPPLDLDIAF